MDDIEEQFRMRDAFRRKLRANKTPEQRVADMFALQARAWKLLKSSPTGYANYLRRNFKARAIDLPPDHAG